MTDVAANENLIRQLLEKDVLIPVVFIVCGSLVALIAIIFTTWGKRSRAKPRELTRREIAAYVAEGSISPQEGIEMLKAAREPSEGEQIENLIKD